MSLASLSVQGTIAVELCVSALASLDLRLEPLGDRHIAITICPLRYKLQDDLEVAFEFPQLVWLSKLRVKRVPCPHGQGTLASDAVTLSDELGRNEARKKLRGGEAKPARREGFACETRRDHVTFFARSPWTHRDVDAPVQLGPTRDEASDRTRA